MPDPLQLEWQRLASRYWNNMSNPRWTPDMFAALEVAMIDLEELQAAR